MRRRGRRSGHSKLNLRPRESSHKPEYPCYLFEREWQSVQNASREGGKHAAVGLKTEKGPQPGTDMDACEGEASGDIECGCCCSDYRFEELVQVKFLSEIPCTVNFHVSLHLSLCSLYDVYIPSYMVHSSILNWILRFQVLAVRRGPPFLLHLLTASNRRVYFWRIKGMQFASLHGYKWL